MKKKILFIIVLTIVVSIIVKINIGAENRVINDKSKNKVKIRVAGDNNFAPYEFIDENGNYSGYNVDIMKAIESAMDVEIEVIPMKWEDAINALEKGEVDAIQGMSKTEERSSRYAFTHPTVINYHAIITLKDNDYINTIDDLKGKRVSYQKGDVQEERIEKLSNVILVPKSDQIEGIKALLEGEADAFIGNKITALYYLNDSKNSSKVKILEEPLGETAYGPVTLSKDNIAYSILNEGINRIKKSGEYDDIYKKWFGDRLLFSNLILRRFIDYAMIAAAVIVLILIFLYTWNTKLKNEVTKRTKELEIAYSEVKSQQDRIYTLAYYDSSTGLPNRINFSETLDKAIENLGEYEKLAVLYLDFDKFKYINDSLGHDIGDNILKIFGSMLQNLMTEIKQVARAGGDEFLILIIDSTKDAELEDKINRIIEKFSEPVIYGGIEIYLTASIGVANYPEGGEDSISLIKNAEIAMYEAKNMGRNSYFIYQDYIGRKGYHNLILLNELRQAVTNEEFVLYYQPKIDINTGNLVDVEALIRWNNPRKGLIYPNEFIPLAEEVGLIYPIGEWVIREACRQIRKWIDMGINPVPISVNISARQFMRHNFLDVISKILEEMCIDPKYLAIEITESIAISDIQYTLEVLCKLKKLGISVIMDDFGTGYSNLRYIGEMKIDELKIDRSFVKNIEKGEMNIAIISTIIELMKKFNISVTAEGVETKEQLNILKGLGCNKAQGYYFSKPIPADELEVML